MDPKYTLLNSIEYPSDLRKLKAEQLQQVCNELRGFIIDELSCNPGHFASSLGVVELTVAMHYVFDTPEDRIVWDVGHQAYGHKILTGRKDRFHTNRKFKGLCGFPNPLESTYDAFIAGHASNSISAALGMSIASSMKEEDRKVIAVIGDGSMTGGLAFEGLNNACVNPNNLLIILNDNNMAIDQAVGGMSKYLTGINTSSFYNKIRFRSYHLLKKLGLMSKHKKSRWMRMTNSMKNMVSGSDNIFEGLDIRYFGQLDGHDVNQLVKTLRDIKNFKGPKVLHIITKKGKGFAPAEDEATIWHAPGRFDKLTGKRVVAAKQDLYQDVFGQTLLDLAQKNNKIVGVTPAMPSGCSMNIMAQKMPERVFDVGIAEAHAVTFSAGLAKEGMMPFCNIYSSFMQRAYDQVIHDVALQNLDLVLCLDRAGLVGEDGPTHHGAFDLSYFRCVPNLTIAAPNNEIDLRNLMYTAQLPNQGPFVIRYPRGKGVGLDWRNTEMTQMEVGKGRCLKEGTDLALLSLGHIGNMGTAALELLGEDAAKIAHYDLVFLKPLDERLLHEVAAKYKKVLCIENGSIMGGMGSAVLEFFADNNYQLQVKRLGLPDTFVEHGPVEKQHELIGIDSVGIADHLREMLK